MLHRSFSAALLTATLAVGVTLAAEPPVTSRPQVAPVQPARGAALVAAPPVRLQALRVEVENLRAKAQQLRDIGQPEQAAQLMVQADKLLAQIDEAPPAVAPAPPVAPPTVKPRRDRLSGPRGRIEELRQMAAKMSAAGRSDDAARLEAEAEAIAARYAQQWSIEMAVMQEQAGRLRADNEEAAAKKIEAEIQARNDELKKFEEARAAQPRPAVARPEERESIERRIVDLQQAAVHLRAGNRPELAEQVDREITQLQARLGPAPLPAGDDAAALRAEIVALRREIAALKAQLDQKSVLVPGPVAPPTIEKK